MLHLEPEPSQFLTNEITSEAINIFGPIQSLLCQSNLLKPLIRYWIRTKVAQQSDWQASVNSDFIAELTQKWIDKNKNIANQMSFEDAQIKVIVAQSCSHWARSNWDHLVSSVYLERKNSLDKASCNLIRVKDKNLALELYFRVKEEEESFAEISYQFGKSPERESGGLITLRSLEALPYGLSAVLPKIKVGECSKPLRIGSDYGIVQLLKFQSASLDEPTRLFILEEMFNHWLNDVSESLLGFLNN